MSYRVQCEQVYVANKSWFSSKNFNQDAWFMEVNHDYNSRENLNFNAPRLNFAACKNLSLFNFPNIWNSLPDALKSNLDKRVLILIKEHIFDTYKASNECTINDCMLCNR